MVEEEEEKDDLKPKHPPKLAPQGIRTFTIQTGVSGEGIVIEGIKLATGQAIAHWLYPPPRGSIAIFDSMTDFLKVHIKPHPENKTILTWDDGEKEEY